MYESYCEEMYGDLTGIIFSAQNCIFEISAFIDAYGQNPSEGLLDIDPNTAHFLTYHIIPENLETILLTFRQGRRGGAKYDSEPENFGETLVSVVEFLFEVVGIVLGISLDNMLGIGDVFDASVWDFMFHPNLPIISSEEKSGVACSDETLRNLFSLLHDPNPSDMEYDVLPRWKCEFPHQEVDFLYIFPQASKLSTRDMPLNEFAIMSWRRYCGFDEDGLIENAIKNGLNKIISIDKLEVLYGIDVWLLNQGEESKKQCGDQEEVMKWRSKVTISSNEMRHLKSVIYFIFLF